MGIIKYSDMRALMFSSCPSSPNEKHALAAAKASIYALPPDADFCCLYCGGWCPKTEESPKE